MPRFEKPKAEDEPPPQKSVCMAYLLWLVGGPFGWHHFYLGRDAQMFLWYTSFGGCLLGWMRDIFRIPEYVESANELHSYKEMLKGTIKAQDKPPYYATRLFAQLFFANLFGVLLSSLFIGWSPTFNLNSGVVDDDDFSKHTPPETHLVIAYDVVSRLLRCVGVAFGAVVVGGVGNYQRVSSIWRVFVPALASEVAMVLGWPTVHWPTTVAAVLGYHMAREWRVESPAARAQSHTQADTQTQTHTRARSQGRGCCSRLLMHMCAYLLFSLLATNYLLHNVTVHTQAGDVPLIESIHNIRRSKEYAQFWVHVSRLWEQMRRDGYEESWRRWKEALDMDGSDHAYEVLGLNKTDADTITVADLKRARNALALQYHPDKVAPEHAAEAEVKFREVQQAYEKLHKIHSAKATRAERAHAQSHTHVHTQTHTQTQSTSTKLPAKQPSQTAAPGKQPAHTQTKPQSQAKPDSRTAKPTTTHAGKTATPRAKP